MGSGLTNLSTMPLGYEMYEVVAHYAFRDTSKIVLRDHNKNSSRRCRFCGGREPRVIFNTTAHAIPESLGNRSIVSLNECDACNRFFGNGYEDDLGKWLGLPRTTLQIKGKKGYPSFKDEVQDFKLSSKCNNFVIELTSPEIFKEIESQDPHTIKINGNFVCESRPYVPFRLAMALLKIACSVVPLSELPRCKFAIDLIMRGIPVDGMPLPVLVSSVPDSTAAKPGEVLILRRVDDSPAPYLWGVMRAADKQLQWPIPSGPDDRFCMMLGSGEKTFHFFSILDDDAPDAGEKFVEDWSKTTQCVVRYDLRLNISEGRRTDQ